jgi:hypothetical protein
VEGLGSGDEGVVRVEAPGRAQSVVAVRQQVLEHGACDYGGDAAAVAATALALAAAPITLSSSAT